jgi:hypothetical protein
MLKKCMTALMAIFLSTSAYMPELVSAQTVAPHVAPAIEDIRLLIVKNLGAQDNTVAVSITGGVFDILRVNSNMNDATHPEFNKEASAIASVVSKAIFDIDTAQYKKIHTIRVRYVNRSGSPAKDKIIDSVEFRKSQNGAFEIHST